MGATLLITGPALWIVIAAPSLWQRRKTDQLSLLNNCCWFTTSLFLRQGICLNYIIYLNYFIIISFIYYNPDSCRSNLLLTLHTIQEIIKTLCRKVIDFILSFWHILILLKTHNKITASTKEPSKTHKARLVGILISLGATYVIGDMYSANLTSLLARPAKEQPIGTLRALEEAMRDKGYELVVESHSSTLAILQVRF